ncbi:MAG TPA: UrcA family protein [Allosphingosinicella sp.]|nr:UrcA family protein [Allosphingosinicella sp.]
MFVRASLFAAALVAGFVNLGLAAGPAMAQAQETITVSYADLNLANAAGRHLFDRRIFAAASQLCGDFAPIELGRAAAGRTCLSATLAAVRPQRDAAVGARYGTVRVSQADLTVSVSRAAN